MTKYGKLFLAHDGTAFRSEQECSDYEKKRKEKESLIGKLFPHYCPPPALDGLYGDNYEYLFTYKVNSLEELNALKAYYRTRYNTESPFPVWIAVFSDGEGDCIFKDAVSLVNEAKSFIAEMEAEMGTQLNVHAVKAAKRCLADNGIEADETETVLTALGEIYGVNLIRLE